MNFIHAKLPDSDRELFFGPLEPNEKFMLFSSEATMANLVVMLGKFPSITQARKNGWDKPIPVGFSAHSVGKTKFWVLNWFEGA